MFSALVTSGPTYEPIDPVRFIGNRSSGKQGHAIAAALCKVGIRVKLISGPTMIPDPEHVHVVKVRTAEEMYQATMQSLPVDVVVCAAAVADWRVSHVSTQKLKKSQHLPPILTLVETKDILKTIAHHPNLRPRLVIGFAAETEDVLEYAKTKRIAKGADWILANQVSEAIGFERDMNQVTLIADKLVEPWERMSKEDIATKLTARIIEKLTQA